MSETVLPKRHQWQQVAQIFDAALDVAPEQRDGWIASACGDDASLEREIRSLLAAYQRTGVLDHSFALSTTTAGPDTRVWEPGTRVGPYEIVQELGRGGMGVVYKALDTRLGRYVALKFLSSWLAKSSKAKEQFLLEARAASVLDHPNICTVYDVGESSAEQLFIAMAHYDGETLAVRLKRGRLSVKEAVDVALQICRGLHCAHEAGIVHRDIKPSNIIITSRGGARILDFGVARIDGSGKDFASQAGTILYAAPEQLSGEDADLRVDIWSVGVVLFEMLCGKRPFEGDDDLATLLAVRHKDAPPVSAYRDDVPEHVQQAVRKALAKNPDMRFRSAEEFAAALVAAPPLKTETARTNLPVAMTSFVGRERDLTRARALLRTSRLLTFTGAAGTGKTRLSMELARAAAPEFRHGAFFVSLAAITDPDIVPAAIAEALGVSPSGVRTVAEDIVHATREQELLLVLDNFEQVTAAAPVVGQLLRALPGLTVVATSRVALRLSGEHELPLPPLAVPGDSDIATLADVPSVQLFVERARAARPQFELTDDNASAVSEICRRLDGLPLAIELAAARIKVLTPAAIASRLGSRLDLLKGGARDIPARHQTLRQALTWSYDLLEEYERRVFRRAGVFAGRFSLEALDAVCGEFGDTPDGALDALSALVDHSLIVQGEGPEGESRFYLLETMREYALDLLRTSGEEQRARHAHVQWFMRLADEAGEALSGGDQARALAHLDADHDNLRIALNWLEEAGDAAAALKMGVSMWRFWAARAHQQEGRARLERLLLRAEDAAAPELRAHGWNACATLAHESCQLEDASRFLERALALFRECGSRQGIALVLNNLAWIAIEMSDFSRAQELAWQAWALHNDIGDKRGLAVALNNLGWVANYMADFAAAEDFHSRSIALRREAGDRRGIAFGLANLAWAEQRHGSYTRALELVAESKTILAEVNDPMLVAWTCQMQAVVLYETGKFAEAIDVIEECIPIWRRVGNSSGMAFGSAYHALALIRTNELAGAAEALETGTEAIRHIPQRWSSGLLLLVRARLAAAQDQQQMAIEHCRSAITSLQQVGDRRSLAEAWEFLAQLLVDEDFAGAADALRSADRLRTEMGSPAAPCDRGAVEAVRAAIASGGTLTS